MRLKITYLFIILLWSTTPLAIKWSAEDSGVIFAAGARMAIGAACMLLVLLFGFKKLSLHRQAIKTYLAVAVQIFGAMMAVYWGAQFIPSGWVSIIFGLSPFLTALFAAFWLKEKNLTVVKIFAYVLGVFGLLVMFNSALELNINAVYGMISVLVAVSLQTASAVWVKRINAKISAFQQVTGGLLFAVPVYGLSWFYLEEARMPMQLSMASLISILYLGAIATTIGFVLYYYLLIHLSAVSVGMIPLISPVIALLLGHYVNHEPFTIKIAAGAVLILTALLIYQFSDRLFVGCVKKSTR